MLIAIALPQKCIRPLCDLDLCSLTLNIFLSVPIHMMNIFAKFLFNPSAEYRDIASREITDGQTDERPENIMLSAHCWQKHKNSATPLVLRRSDWLKNVSVHSSRPFYCSLLHKLSWVDYRPCRPGPSIHSRLPTPTNNVCLLCALSSSLFDAIAMQVGFCEVSLQWPKAWMSGVSAQIDLQVECIIRWCYQAWTSLAAQINVVG